MKIQITIFIFILLIISLSGCNIENNDSDMTKEEALQLLSQKASEAVAGVSESDTIEDESDTSEIAEEISEDETDESEIAIESKVEPESTSETTEPEISSEAPTGDPVWSDYSVTKEMSSLTRMVVANRCDDLDDKKTVLCNELTDANKRSMVYSFINSYSGRVDVEDEIGMHYEEINCYVNSDKVNLMLSDLTGSDFSNFDLGRDVSCEGEEYKIIPSAGDPGIRYVDLVASSDQYGNIVMISTIEDGYYNEFTSMEGERRLVKVYAHMNQSSRWGFTIDQIDYMGKAPTPVLETSSEYSDSTATYWGRNLVDGKMNTTWVPGGSNGGLNESIIIQTSEESPIYGVSIANGYYKSEKAYYNNAIATKISISYNGKTDEYTLEKRVGYYAPLMDGDIAFSDMITFSEPVYTKEIVITILDAEAGDKYNDICISELLLIQ